MAGQDIDWTDIISSVSAGAGVCNSIRVENVSVRVPRNFIRVYFGNSWEQIRIRQSDLQRYFIIWVIFVGTTIHITMVKIIIAEVTR